MILLAFGVGLTPSASAATRYDPALRFRTIRTTHFEIHAHQGEEAMARRLAAIAEQVRERFVPALGTPRGRVHVILVDQADVSNGWATPVPFDTIEITAAAPSPETSIGNTTDWLELAFTHEYTHILHLDRSRGFVQGLRRVFGRVPVAFPNLFLPTWQIEGIAVFEESRLTGEGRIPAGDFRAIVDVAASHGRFERIDRAGGGLDDWPRGDAPYAYGGYFHQFLSDRYGAERLARLADATAGRVPLFGGGAFRRVYGRPAAELWDEFRRAHESGSAPSSSTDARATRSTHDGFSVAALRGDDRGALYYARNDADRFPALMRVAPGGRPERVAWRVGGGRTSIRGGWIVFDSLERVHAVALVSDLYAVRTSGGRVRRLTNGGRAADPDLSPDGRRIVCTVQNHGVRALALLDFAPDAVSVPRIIVSGVGEDYGGPRWSPDGRQIVAERRHAGVYELVLIDARSFAVAPLIARGEARLVTPSWSSDGSTVLFAASIGGRPFNVFAVDGATRAVRQVTDTAGGAQSPELSSDGTLAYIGYTPDGYDVFSVRTRADEWAPVDFREVGDFRLQAEDQAEDRPYNPLRTLVPTYWTPIIATDAGETRVGAATAMSDALGRHSYAVDAAWAARSRPDWHASYVYDRWRPTIVASYSDDTDPIRGGEVRSQELLTGLLVPFRRVRWSETAMGAFDVERDTVACTGQCRAPGRELHSLRGGWLHDSRRAFGYSISAEEGALVQVAAETSRTAFGSDVDAGAAILDVRAYHRLLGPHTVLAARVAAADAWGRLDARRVFSASGPGVSAAAFSFGRDAIGLLRGVAADALVGSRAASASLDLRFPIARIERGLGTWPLFVRSVHGAAFVDTGHAWDGAFRAADVRASIGGELSTNLVLVHYAPVTLAAGAAWTRDPSRPHRAAVFGRVGYAF